VLRLRDRDHPVEERLVDDVLRAVPEHRDAVRRRRELGHLVEEARSAVLGELRAIFGEADLWACRSNARDHQRERADDRRNELVHALSPFGSTLPPAK